MIKFRTIAAAGLIVMAIGFAGGARADIEFFQDVTPDVIFGSGNANGFFTTDRRNNIEVGIRAKIPFVSAGDGTYTFDVGDTWNFDFTVNTDVDGTSGLKVDDFTYELGLEVTLVQVSIF